MLGDTIEKVCRLTKAKSVVVWCDKNSYTESIKTTLDKLGISYVVIDESLMTYDRLEQLEPSDLLVSIDSLNISTVEKLKCLDCISRKFSFSCIQMKGSDKGFSTLSVFFWSISSLGSQSLNLWLCGSSDNEGNLYTNLKKNNILGGRSVFLKLSSDGVKTVVKREVMNFRHYWLKTNLIHELEMYFKLKCDFVAKLISFDSDDKFRWLEIEYLEQNSNITKIGIDNIYDVLIKENVFIMDIMPDSFIGNNGHVFLVDLESLFYFRSQISELAEFLVNPQQSRCLVTHQQQKQITLDFWRIT
jgi:hypothetical protein